MPLSKLIITPRVDFFKNFKEKAEIINPFHDAHAISKKMRNRPKLVVLDGNLPNIKFGNIIEEIWKIIATYDIDTSVILFEPDGKQYPGLVFNTIEELQDYFEKVSKFSMQQ